MTDIAPKPKNEDAAVNNVFSFLASPKIDNAIATKPNKYANINVQRIAFRSVIANHSGGAADIPISPVLGDIMADIKSKTNQPFGLKF
ncbi:hypothetical protein BGP_1938 [Beggiatoa sp. PS]|nr:hypothetical protein BGP_1938 [Beggiatoa sp. PS]